MIRGSSVLPDNGAVHVHNEHVWVSIPGRLVVSPVSPGHIPLFVVQDGEWISLCPGRQGWAGEVVNGDCEYLCVQFSELVVFPSQLPELLNTVGSPESPVEHQHDVSVPAVGLEADQLAVGTIGQGEQRRRIFRRFRQGCGRGCRLGRCGGRWHCRRSRCRGDRWLRCCRGCWRRERSGCWLRSHAGLRFGGRSGRWHWHCRWHRGCCLSHRWYRRCSGRRCRSGRWVRRLHGCLGGVRSPGRRHRSIRRIGRYCGLWLLRGDRSLRRDGSRRWRIGGSRHCLCLIRRRGAGGFLPAGHQGSQEKSDNRQRTQRDSRGHSDICYVAQRKSPPPIVPRGFRVVPFYYGKAERADSTVPQARQRTGCPPL